MIGRWGGISGVAPFTNCCNLLGYLVLREAAILFGFLAEVGARNNFDLVKSIALDPLFINSMEEEDDETTCDNIYSVVQVANKFNSNLLF